MCLLNQFMNADTIRLIVRNTHIVTRITSTACPVWFSTVPDHTET